MEDGGQKKAEVLADLLEPLLSLHPREASLEGEDEEEDGGHGSDGLLLVVVVAQEELGCNSIDILNLGLELGRKLRQGLRKRLGTRFLAVG